MAAADTLPKESLLNGYCGAKDFMDVYSGDIGSRPELLTCDIREFAVHFTKIDMPWAKTLLKLRDTTVKPLGLKTTKDLAEDAKPKRLAEVRPGDRIGFFKVYEILENELLIGEDDWHQDFRLSVYRDRKGDSPRVFLSTCCKRHNPFGYAYLALILPFHKMLVRQSIERGLERPLLAVA